MRQQMWLFFLSVLQAPSNHGRIMRPPSRHRLWKRPKVETGRQSVTHGGRKGPGSERRTGQRSHHLSEMCGRCRLTKAPTFFNQTLPSVSAYCLLGNAAAKLREKHFFAPTSTSSSYSNTVTNHWFIHCLYTSRPPPLRPSAPPSSRPHRHKHPRSTGLTLPFNHVVLPFISVWSDAQLSC